MTSATNFLITMAGLDPATQPASVCELNELGALLPEVIRRADARRLGGRLGGRPW
jgi:hypothetical protein